MLLVYPAATSFSLMLKSATGSICSCFQLITTSIGSQLIQQSLGLLTVWTPSKFSGGSTTGAPLKWPVSSTTCGRPIRRIGISQLPSSIRSPLTTNSNNSQLLGMTANNKKPILLHLQATLEKLLQPFQMQDATSGQRPILVVTSF